MRYQETILEQGWCTGEALTATIPGITPIAPAAVLIARASSTSAHEEKGFSTQDYHLEDEVLVVPRLFSSPVFEFPPDRDSSPTR